MKYIFLLTMFLLSEFKICKAQNASLFDSLESTFDSISIGAKMPCQWKMTLQKKANGKLTFFEKDSTSIEFDHFMKFAYNWCFTFWIITCNNY